MSLWVPPPAWAQTSLLEVFQENKKEEVEKLPLKEEIQNKKQEALKELASVQKDLTGLNVAPGSKQAKNLKNQKDLLEELNLYYEQILEALNRGEELAQQNQGILHRLNLWSQEGPPEILSPSFTLLDQFSDQLQLELRRIEASGHSIETLKTSLEETKREYDILERKRRQIKEEVETADDPTAAASLKSTLSVLQLESRVAWAKGVLLQTDLNNEILFRKNAELEKDLLIKRIGWLKENIRFSEEDLQNQLAQIDRETQELGEAIKTARSEFQSFEKRRKAERLTEPDGTPVPTQISPAELESYQAQRRAHQNRISVLAQRFQRLDELEEAWRRRYLAFNNLAEKTQLTEWKKETESAEEQVHRQETLVNVRLSDLRKKLAELEEKIMALGESNPSLGRILNEQKRQVKKLISANEDYLASLARESQLYQKFLSEIEPQVAHFSVRERFSLIWDKVIKVWNFEITSIDDKPITVKKLVFVLILLLLGFRFSRRLSLWFGSKVLPKFGLEKGVAAGLQTLVFYLLVTFVTVLVLYIVNVPLTMFTVLGGALAIGVGFGSQAIVRNFISGLILLMEQPIKIGDMVEVDETYGTIEKIGARSTRIRKFNNVHVIVPNSDLLEKKVINWTLSDDLVRIVVTVGVAYGSPTRDVSKLIRRAVDEHGKVIPNPEPIVLFKEFGDNALLFEVHFWIKMRTVMERERVESDIRFRIDSLFREAGITIAFPQRDVHLDSLSPIQVQVLKEEPSPETGTAPGKELP